MGKKWIENKIFEPKVDKSKKKYYLTVAYPYLSGELHVGHARTYTITDVIARYKRMSGYNVLFPMAWHATGAPIIGIAKRVEKKDKELYEIYTKIYKVPKETLDSFSDPKKVVEYFRKRAKETFIRAGCSIDWTREFVTTPLTPTYSRFIEWQFNKLKEAGYIKKGSHRVMYCPSCDNPIGEHDLLEGEDATILEYTLIPFSFEGHILPAATLRPETTLAVTNMWLNPKAVYVKALVGEQKMIVSKEAAEKLKYQDKKVKIEREFPGRELIGKKCKNPLTGNSVPILPADFVDPDNATGVVMSVPAHAPYDYVALRDLQDDVFQVLAELGRYGINAEMVEGIKPISLIQVEGYGDFPAAEEVEKLKIGNQKDVDKLETATKSIYKIEYHTGKIRSEWGEYAGMRVEQAKSALKEKIISLGGGIMFEFSQKPVTCRCNTPAVVKIIHDQWFIDYGNSDWKELTRECLENSRIVPEDRRGQFESIIEWLDMKACARNVGLGTPLPWDRRWIIESLSDSTIYMAYYTIARIINEKKITAKQLSDQVFDRVFKFMGNPETPWEKHMREEFEYWYPLDMRLSGKDLITNHLCFMMFNHVAIFDRRFWTKGIAVNGFGTFEGDKMSKSKGNVLNWIDAIEEFGADTVRLYIMGLAEHTSDFDWKNSEISNLTRQLVNLEKQAKNIIKKKEGKKNESLDRWLINRLNRAVKESTAALEDFRTRTAIMHSFYNLSNDLKWYIQRGGDDRAALRSFLEKWLLLLAPFTPHICEELWAKLGKKGFVSIAKWPSADEGAISDKLELGENLIRGTVADIKEIIKLVGKQPQRICLYTAPEWKYELYDMALGMKKDPNSLVSEAMKRDTIKKHGQDAVKYAQKLLASIGKLNKEILGAKEEFEILNGAEDFLSKEFKCPVNVYSPGKPAHDPQSKAKSASVMKPAIYLE